MSFLQGLAPALAALVLSQTGGTSITGTATYRERMALTPDAVLIAALDRFHGSAQTQLSELTMSLNGRQVPISFTLPYEVGRTESGTRFGVRARILDRGRVQFETASHAMVIANGVRQVRLNLVRSAPLPGPGVVDTDWTLMVLDGKVVPFTDRLPTLRFDSSNGRVVGFGSVNRFGGSFAYRAPMIQIDPGASTLMAGPADRMQVESTMLRLLPLVNRAEIEAGELTLLRGDRPLMRFRR